MRRIHTLIVIAVFACNAAQADEMSFPKLMPVDVPGAPQLSEPVPGDGRRHTGTDRETRTGGAGAVGLGRRRQT